MTGIRNEALLLLIGGFDFDIEAGLTYNIALIEDYTFGTDFETFMLNVLPHSIEEYERIRQDRSVKVRKDDNKRKSKFKDFCLRMERRCVYK